MIILYATHILAGSLGLLTGYTALYAAKGGPLHRRIGRVFVYVMLTMAVLGLTIAALRNVAPAINVPAALITAYLVITSLLTVTDETDWTRRVGYALMVMAFVVSMFDFRFAYEAFANGGLRKEMPAFVFFMFGIPALLGSVGDLKLLRSGPLRGSRRIARHLWRMCYALFIAALSFFLGQAHVIPEPLRKPLLLALPVIAVPVTMLYWLWRVRFRQVMRGMTQRSPLAIT